MAPCGSFRLEDDWKLNEKVEGAEDAERPQSTLQRARQCLARRREGRKE
jgi:hypothetical protein